MMPALRGITVAVGEWYARTLEICLVRNMRHLVECWVVTKPGDPCVEVARAVPGVRVVETDAFTRHGAILNKGLALEETFDAMGRRGWCWIWDADCLWPDAIPLDRLDPAALHGARRRVLEDPAAWHPGLDWSGLRHSHDGGPIGHTQIFHADAPALRGARPWYDVSFGHAGGGDAAFIEHWKRARQPIVMLPMEVLHLGPVDRHWFGADREGQDMMGRFVTENGWRKAAARFTAEEVERAGEPVHRVEVPGYPPSSYELPFVRRAGR